MIKYMNSRNLEQKVSRYKRFNLILSQNTVENVLNSDNCDEGYLK